MTVETATYISDLVSTNPAASDLKSEGDDHLRLLKSTVKITFPNVTGPVTPTHTVINNMAGGAFPTVPLSGITTINSSFFDTDANGRVYGTSLHNNASSPTGTTNQYLASGTYTPTLTSVSNVQASTAYACQWMRVGNVVTVSGKVDVDTTTIGNTTQLGMSLPLASGLTSDEQLGGVAAAATAGGFVSRIYGDAANDRAQFEYRDQNTSSNISMTFTFTYVVL